MIPQDEADPLKLLIPIRRHISQEALAGIAGRDNYILLAGVSLKMGIAEANSLRRAQVTDRDETMIEPLKCFTELPDPSL
ncbi:MAG: hypothetical protein ACU84Q_01150 [Gammaproteobacteria bacterium]